MGAGEKFLTSREYADRSGLSVSKVTKLLREGGLKGRKVAGKWMIPASELDAAASSAASPWKPSTPQKPAAPPPSDAPPAGRTFSIAEFSALTYLTEYGVRDWLKRGILKGIQAEDGESRIDATNLEAPHLKHLVR